jgi:hypothetical protein
MIGWGARARLDAEVAAGRPERDAMVGPYLARIGAGVKIIGRIPVEARVALAERRLTETIAAYQAKLATRSRRGRPPVPVEHHSRVRQARAQLHRARAAGNRHAGIPPLNQRRNPFRDSPCANVGAHKPRGWNRSGSAGEH